MASNYQPSHCLISFEDSEKNGQIVPINKVFRRVRKKLVNIREFGWNFNKREWHYVLNKCADSRCEERLKVGQHEHTVKSYLHDLSGEIFFINLYNTYLIFYYFLVLKKSDFV